MFDTFKPPASGFVDVYPGKVVDDPDVHVHEIFEIGSTNHKEFEKNWPTGFQTIQKECEEHGDNKTDGSFG